MKNIFEKLTVAAAVVAALVSCQKAQVEKEYNLMVYAAEAPETAEVPETAEAPETAEVTQTKTHLDANRNVLWDSSSEKMRIFCASDKDAEPAYADSENATLSDGGKKATFSFNFSGIESANNFIYGGVYPSSAVSKAKQLSNVRLLLPSVQNPTATTYDPAAFIMVAKPQTFTEVQKTLNQRFRKVVALNKVTLTGLNLAEGEKVRSVTFTAPYYGFACAQYFSLSSGDATGYDSVADDSSKSITLNYATPFTPTGGTFDAWFTSWETLISGGQSLGVEVVTDKARYIRNAYTDNKKTVTFKEGKFNTLTVTMDTADKTTL